MPAELLQLLLQIPLVGAFIWFVLEKDKRDKVAQEKRDEMLQKVLDMKSTAEREAMQKLVSQLGRMNQNFEEHDRFLRDAVSTMRERTRPRKSQPGERSNE